jgi:hypothetical protein
MIRPYVRIAGITLFAISFALPAVRLGSPFEAGSSFSGWFCAGLATLIAPWQLLRGTAAYRDASTWLVLFSGLINPLIVAVLVLIKWPRLTRARLIISVCLAPGFIATWVYFAKESMRPRIGHYLWVGGAVLFVLPDLLAMLPGQARLEPVSFELDPANTML